MRKIVGKEQQRNLETDQIQAGLKTKKGQDKNPAPFLKSNIL